MRFGRPTIVSAVAVLGLSVTVAACGRGRERKRHFGASGSSSGKKIALLLPEHTTARYETQDRPHFESMVKSLCPTARSSMRTRTRTRASSSRRRSRC